MASGSRDGKLSHRKVETAAAGTYDDGRGLRLVVSKTGARKWILRYQIDGRRRDMGLGPFPEVSLSRAREKALDARRLVKERRDPLVERSRSKALTFRAAAEALIEAKRPGWRNAKHAAQWTATLEAYAFSKLGALDVKTVDTDIVLAALRPIWTQIPETASRVRQRIEAVLDYAGALKARTGENPGRWRG
ncbi:tyrosine-type recombinase/integrase, partial [Geminicoccus flavidas]|uniref:tyrosine-type recombinase/integrase n=1 Tax=Geminicoccus flavidas TaxID=2506407 RepID=UPI00135B848D